MERETVVEAGISGLAVAAFVAAAVAIGTTSGGDDLTSSGALAVVGAIVGFIVLMSLVGILLERR